MYDIIVIGGGSAGLGAALISARNRFKTLLIDKGPEHGALGQTVQVSDILGIEGTLSGIEVAGKLKKQITDLGGEIKQAAVTSCISQEKSKRVVTNEPVNYDTKVVILATGNMPHQESHVYQGEKELRGKGISHDAITDAPACKNAAVAIVGKSQATAEAAIRLAQFAEKVYWIIPTSKLEFPNNINDELDRITKIEYLYSSSLKKINGTSEVSSISLLSAGQEKLVSVKYVFLPPQPYKPATDFLNGSGVQTSQDGVVMVNENFETSIVGIFAVGNVLCLKPQLNMVCAAQGAIAALNSETYLR